MTLAARCLGVGQHLVRAAALGGRRERYDLGADGAKEVFEHSLVQRVDGDLVGAQQRAAVERRHSEPAERPDDLLLELLPTHLIPQQGQVVHDLDTAVVVGLLVHETVDRVPLLLVPTNQQIGAGEGVVALGADGDDGVAAGLLSPDQVPDRRHMVDEIVVGQRKDRTAAVPTIQLDELDAERIKGGHGGLFQVGGLCFERTTGVIAKLHERLTR